MINKEMTYKELCEGPVKKKFSKIFQRLIDIDAPTDVMRDFTSLFSEMVEYVFDSHNFLITLDEVMDEKYGEEERKTLSNIACDRINIKNGSLKRDEIQHIITKGNVVSFPGTVLEE